MNTQVMEGKWARLRGDLQKRWGRLTNDDLDQIEGELTNLEGKLRERYGYTKAEASEQVDKFLHEAREQLDDVQARFGRKLRDSSEEVQQRVRDAREKLQEVEAKDVAQTMKSNPLLLVGAMVLLSVFVGLWIKSMKR